MKSVSAGRRARVSGWRTLDLNRFGSFIELDAKEYEPCQGGEAYERVDRDREDDISLSFS
jgi:hypothetical protein